MIAGPMELDDDALEELKADVDQEFYVLECERETWSAPLAILDLLGLPKDRPRQKASTYG